MSNEDLQQTDNNTNVTPPPAEDFDSEARAQGWVAKEEFRGNENDWVDAETFVKRGREILPIVRKNNEKLLKELKEAKAIAEEARATAKEFQKFQKEQYERKAKDLEAQLAQLKQAKREAISSGDGDRVIELDDASDSIREELNQTREAAKAEPPAPPAQENKPDATLQAWLDKNEWFGNDVRTTGIANGLGEALRRENPGLQGQAFLDRLDEELATVLPDKFGKKKVANPMDVGSGTTGGRPAKSKRSYDSLPADAKAACDRFVKQGLMTKEQYIDAYEWSE